MTRKLSIVAALGLVLAATGSVSAQPQDTVGSRCFTVDQFQDWRAPDARTIYIRVLLNKYYRLDLAGACPELKEPSSHLITHTRGPDTVCSAVDWDLRVSEGPSRVSSPCIVRSMTLLTPQDVAAIPPQYKP